LKTTLNVGDRLIERARQVTGIQAKTALVDAGPNALIARAASKRLIALGGAEPKAPSVPRRRTRRASWCS
jgi:hypothetical protein